MYWNEKLKNSNELSRRQITNLFSTVPEGCKNIFQTEIISINKEKDKDKAIAHSNVFIFALKASAAIYEQRNNGDSQQEQFWKIVLDYLKRGVEIHNYQREKKDIFSLNPRMSATRDLIKIGLENYFSDTSICVTDILLKADDIQIKIGSFLEAQSSDAFTDLNNSINLFMLSATAAAQEKKEAEKAKRSANNPTNSANSEVLSEIALKINDILQFEPGSITAENLLSFGMEKLETEFNLLRSQLMELKQVNGHHNSDGQ